MRSNGMLSEAGPRSFWALAKGCTVPLSVTRALSTMGWVRRFVTRLDAAGVETWADASPVTATADAREKTIRRRVREKRRDSGSMAILFEKEKG